MTTEKNILIFKCPTFYSRKDEDALFEWIKKIECIENHWGAGPDLHLEIPADDIHDHDLRDLLSLFYRYSLDMKILERFLTEDNRKWFYDNKEAYWHGRVFGPVHKPRTSEDNS